MYPYLQHVTVTYIRNKCICMYISKMSVKKVFNQYPKIVSKTVLFIQFDSDSIKICSAYKIRAKSKL